MTLAPSATTVLSERYVPVIPDEFKIYDSYTVDPEWQIRFTIIWTSVLALSTLLSAPYIYKTLRRGEYFKTLFVNERPAEQPSSETSAYSSRPSQSARIGSTARIGLIPRALYQSVALRSVAIPTVGNGKGPRRYLSLGLGQCLAIAVYLAISIICFTVGAELLQNSNRPGFVALAQLPLIVLLSLKSPLPLPIFLPTLSYEHYNFLHRYAGRTLFLLVTVHGSMWINQYRTTNQMDQVWSDKSKRGMIAYGIMCGIVLTSLKPVRRTCYQIFWLSHLVLFTGFFAAISYHTPYAAKWVYPCVAIYGYDFTVRMLRYRVKDAIIVPVDETTTLIHVPDCGSGWKPTQHIFLRVLRGPGIFEAHPFTITNAPSLPGPALRRRGITLYAKAAGDWTKRLHAQATNIAAFELGEDIYEREAFLKLEKEGQVDAAEHPGKRVAVVLDGPYGGLKIDVGEYGRVLCLAGGSGITFALGVVEAAICARSTGVVHTVDVVWAVREASLVKALSPTLVYLHRTARSIGLGLNLHVHLSDSPSASPSDSAVLSTQLPPATVTHLSRPDVPTIVMAAALNVKLPGNGGEEASPSGLAVVACGPEGLVAAARNAVGAISIPHKMAAGGMSFHGECYSL